MPSCARRSPSDRARGCAPGKADMDLAIKDVQRHTGKFLAAILGVGLLMAIVLIMNGIFQGNTADGVWLIENTATDLWVVEYRRGGPFNEQAPHPSEALNNL